MALNPSWRVEILRSADIDPLDQNLLASCLHNNSAFSIRWQCVKVEIWETGVSLSWNGRSFLYIDSQKWRLSCWSISAITSQIYRRPRYIADTAKGFQFCIGMIDQPVNQWYRLGFISKITSQTSNMISMTTGWWCTEWTYNQLT